MVGVWFLADHPNRVYCAVIVQVVNDPSNSVFAAYDVFVSSQTFFEVIKESVTVTESPDDRFANTGDVQRLP